MLTSTSSTAGGGTVVAAAEPPPHSPTRTGGDDNPGKTRPPHGKFRRPRVLMSTSSCRRSDTDRILTLPVRGERPVSPVRGEHGGRRIDGGLRGRGTVDGDGSLVGASVVVRHRAVRAATSGSAPGPRWRTPLLFGLLAGACLCLLVAASVIPGLDSARGHLLYPSDGGGDTILSTSLNAWTFDGHGAGGGGDRRLLRRRMFRESRVGGGGGSAVIERAGIDIDNSYRERRKQLFLEEELASTTAADSDGDGATLHPPSLLPLSSGDLWGLALAVVGLMLAAGGGVGGGGILVPIYTLVLRFSPRHAIPLSNVTVFGGAVANAIFNSMRRHPSADRPLVDWDLMLVMEPLTISGALIGSFVNKLLPETVLVVVLVLLLSFTAYNTLGKAKWMHDKESKDYRALNRLEMETEAECGREGAYVDDDFHPGRPPRRGEEDYFRGSNVCFTHRRKTMESDVMETKDEQIIVDDDCAYDEIEEELEALVDRLREGLVREDERVGGEGVGLVDAPSRPSPPPPPKNCNSFRPLLLRRRSSPTMIVVSPTYHENHHQLLNGCNVGSGQIRARSAPLECHEQRGDANSVPVDSSRASFCRCAPTTSSDEEKKECSTPSGWHSHVAGRFQVSSLPPFKRKAYGDVELVEISYSNGGCPGDAGERECDGEVGGDDCGDGGGSKWFHGPGNGLWGRRYEPKAAKTTAARGDAADQDPSAALLDRILEEERHPPLRNVGTLCGMFLVVIVVNILKGGGAFSPLGVACGSAPFWMSETFLNVWVLSVFAIARSQLVRRAELKRRVGYLYVEGDIEWTPSATVIYPAICCLSGFFAGMFGIGGGIVKGPLMLAMGVHPAVASATSACMILFTSLVATTSYGVFGLLVPDYAAACLCVGFVATLLGQAVMSGLLRRHGRSSYIAFSIGVVVLLSAVCMTAESVVSIMRGWDGEAGGGHDAGGLCSTVE